MHYVIGDIHGSYNELMNLLDKIEKQDSDAQFIFVGDFVDRGPDVPKILNWALNNITLDGKYQSVRGNHEALVIDWYKEWIFWWKSGGFDGEELMPETHFDFSIILEELNYLSPERISPFIDFFKSLPFRKEINITTTNGVPVTYDIVHAWDNFNPDIHEDDRNNTNIWKRNCEGNFENDVIIVHGHTPTISDMYRVSGFTRPGMIGYRHNSINIDGGCCFNRSYRYYPCFLCAICLETLEEFYNSDIEQRFFEISQGYDSVSDIQYKIGTYIDCFFNKPDKHREDILKRLKLL